MNRTQLRLWTSHSIYHNYLHDLVPGSPHTLLLTIVRAPMRRWLSAWEFYDLPRRKGYTLLSHSPRLWGPRRVSACGGALDT